jgi:hypothetical protein
MESWTFSGWLFKALKYLSSINFINKHLKDVDFLNAILDDLQKFEIPEDFKG